MAWFRIAGWIAVLGAGLAAASVSAPAAARPDFATWLQELRQEAVARGISEVTLDAALADVAPDPRVIAYDREQPEFTQTFSEYLAMRVTEPVVQRGRELMRENRALLERVQAQYGVQPWFIVALWGIETQYGRYTGGFHVIPALVTLAYDARRSDKFREELFYALRIIDEGHITPDSMTGSWAGAMGQAQFMPSTFVTYAVDADADGHRDIWSSKADVFASAANFLARSGWRGDQTWGREVRLPPQFDLALADDFEQPLDIRDPRRRLTEWQALGVRRADGSDLPTRDLLASLILPDGPGGPAYVVYDNFRALIAWNPSFLFAATVGHLADRLRGG
jgi:membrane-bound lytic murein transglycosylase B